MVRDIQVAGRGPEEKGSVAFVPDEETWTLTVARRPTELLPVSKVFVDGSFKKQQMCLCLFTLSDESALQCGLFCSHVRHSWQTH